MIDILLGIVLVHTKLLAELGTVGRRVEQSVGRIDQLRQSSEKRGQEGLLVVQQICQEREERGVKSLTTSMSAIKRSRIHAV